MRRKIILTSSLSFLVILVVLMLSVFNYTAQAAYSGTGNSLNRDFYGRFNRPKPVATITPKPTPTATATPRPTSTATAIPRLTATATTSPTPVTTTPSAGMDSEETAFLTLINQYRQSNGLTALTLNQNLVNASEWMSLDMAANNYMNHTDSLGRDPFTRMAAVGYTANTSKGENIAAGYTTASAVFAGWKSSSGHNANMLNANYRVIGIGRAYNANSTYKWYWTTDFGGQ